jgi:hypothetical protein
MNRALLLALAAAGLLLGPGSASAQFCAPLGRISEIIANYGPSMNDGHIQRADSSTDPLKIKAPLYSGDAIVVTSPGLSVQYVVGSQDRILSVDLAHPMPALPARSPGQTCKRPPGPYTRAALAGDRPIIVQTVAHNDQAPTLRAGAALPLGEQWLPGSVSQIAVVWVGGDAGVSIDRQKPIHTLVPFAVLDRPSGPAFHLTVTGDYGGEAKWAVRSTGRLPPLPAELAGPGPLTDDDRLERALWLLDQGPALGHWRLFALSEIASLKDSSFAADMAWRQIVAGPR